MKILVACEESQAVTIEMRRLGHEAYSCDIIECSGGHPEWHIQCDVLPLLNGNCEFVTMDGISRRIDEKWDLIIAHPPCTYLTLAGNKWFKPEFADRFPDRQKQRKEAVDFFMDIANADCDKIAIENPVGVMSSQWRKPDQYIEPYMFGDPEKKKTGLWLKGLPLLKPTNVVEPVIIHCKSGANEPRWHMETMHLPKAERSRLRSQTFIGIAKAMAEQWAGVSKRRQTMSNKALKPCPFCGGKACVKTSTTTYTPSIPTAKVYCKKCNSSTASYTDLRKDGTFLFDAIDAWNRRAGEEGKHE